MRPTTRSSRRAEPQAGASTARTGANIVLTRAWLSAVALSPGCEEAGTFASVCSTVPSMSSFLRGCHHKSHVGRNVIETDTKFAMYQPVSVVAVVPRRRFMASHFMRVSYAPPFEEHRARASEAVVAAVT